MLEKYDLLEIDSIESMPYNEEVCDFEVEQDHSYTVEDIIVHNSVCTTRTVTGCGYPQISAVISCADSAHGLGGHICSDGGIRQIGDIAKAIGAGADFVMLGGVLAGYDECEGMWSEIDGERESLSFYGMSSREAQDKYNGGLKRYRAAEGKLVEVKYKGNVEPFLQEIKGGMVSACSYVGAERLKDFSKKTTFILVNRTHDNYA